MERLAKTILRVHGLFLVTLGIIMTIQTLMGTYKGLGILRFTLHDPLKSVGLFEAYLLAAFSGFVLFLHSGKHYRKIWHVLAASVHLILLVTNLLFWEAYSLADIVLVGYVSTSAHAVFILIECSCYYVQIRHNQSKIN